MEIEGEKILQMLKYLPDIVVNGQKRMFIRSYDKNKALLIEIAPVELAEKLYKGRLYAQALYHDREETKKPKDTEEEQKRLSKLVDDYGNACERAIDPAASWHWEYMQGLKKLLKDMIIELCQRIAKPKE